MDENSQQTSSEPPPTSAPGPQAGYGMPPTTNYPMSSGGGMVSQDERTQATLMWVISIFASLFAPLIFYLISKDKPFVYRHSAMALSLCIVLFIACFILGITLVGMILIPLVWIAQLVVCIMGAMAANKGEEYNPPVVSGLAHSLFKV